MKINEYIPRKRLYTIPESAEYLGHTEWGVRSLIWAKKLPVVRHGRKQWLDIYDLDNFIEKNKKFAG
jgi:hypothetical protein